ncbi:MAG: PASTA domain-containing protein [Deltaproteobacteria bacterium]|nr:PASTA domain-containing protein [Deltaproteobacteria bacterium]
MDNNSKNNNRLQESAADPSAGAKTRDWGKIWLVVVGLGLLVIWAMLWHRFYILHVVEGPEYEAKAQKQHNTRETFTGSRGSIEDRHGTTLAKSVESYSLAARPAKISALKETGTVLSGILNIPEKNLLALLASKENFIWVSRKISDQEAKKIFEADLPGIYLHKESERIYPHKHLAGQLLGFVSMDNKGLDGLEASFEEFLAGRELRKVVQRDALGDKLYMHGRSGTDDLSGKNLRLTIDLQIQHYAESALERTMRENGGAWGGCLVVDVATGDILAWAHYPFFNPNIYNKQPEPVRRNKLALDALEQGSTVKAFVVAAALQEGKIKPDTVIYCEDGKWQINNHQIKDTHPHKNLTVEEILRYSSNIGAGKIGLRLGAATYGRYLQTLGFGKRTGLPLVGESSGILRPPAKWPDIDLASSSFGQSFSATGLQMVQAYLCLANNGVKKNLQLFVNENLRAKDSGERIFSEEVSLQVLGMLKSAVHSDGGPGRQARVAGFTVGGKTGTSQKAEGGIYGEKRVASFIGMVPAEKPRYLVMVIVDEPKKSIYGASVAAPAFREILEQTLAYRGLTPEETAAMLAEMAPGSSLPGGEGPSADLDLALYAQNKAREAAALKTGARDASAPAVAGSAALATAEDAAPNRLRLSMLPNPAPEAGAPKIVPDVRGMSVRGAVEVFAHEDIMPILKGQGSTVVRQSPEPGAKFSYHPETQYILWLEEKTL